MQTKSYCRGLVNYALRSDVDFWVSHEHKLIFLKIPKIASSYFRALFILNHSQCPDFDLLDETPRGYKRRTGVKNIPLKKKLPVNYPGYKKFVVLRDPMARTVSAFLDRLVKKVAKGDPNRPTQKFYDRVGRLSGKTLNERTITFEDFLNHILSCPDVCRDRHYKSQRHFIKEHDFDFYGDISNMAEIQRFLRKQGMVTEGITVKARKKTVYAEPNCHQIKYPAKASVALLNSCSCFPSISDFFDELSLGRFLNEYKGDLDLYSRVRGVDSNEVIARYMHD